ncbi:diguanylate cyclase domain-containing protein [Litoribacillus peritrichatus]
MDWLYRAWYQTGDFAESLRPHIFWLVVFVVTFALQLFLNGWIGDVKPVSEWDWVDILGEGAAAFCVFAWLLIILSIRLKGRVTNLFALGFIGVFVSLFQDVLDEFYQLPKVVSWDSWLESMPVGLVILTYAFLLWRREQRQINRYMQKRELFHRNTQTMDGGLALPTFQYLKNQLAWLCSNDPQSWRHAALVFIEIHQYNDISHDHGGQEADRFLHVVSELILLNLNRNDLLCRYAGGRFTILILEAKNKDLKKYTSSLIKAVNHFTYRTSNQVEEFDVQASAAFSKAWHTNNPEELIEQGLQALRDAALAQKHCEPLTVAEG